MFNIYTQAHDLRQKQWAFSAWSCPAAVKHKDMQNGPWDWKHVADLQDGWDVLRPFRGDEIFQLSNIHLFILTLPFSLKKG